MLNREQIRTLLLIRNRERNLLSNMPVELIREISDFGQDLNSVFAKALHHVAYGKLEEAKAMLETDPRLVLQAGTVVTPGGLTVVRTTLLECALGAGDPEMVAMMMPYFSKFEGGEKEKEKQLDRYRPCIKAMQEQKPYDLTWLIDILKKSTASDVTAALNKDMTHESELRDALLKFRNDIRPGTVTKPRMHYNYQNLIHAFDILDREWNNLESGNNFAKCDLVWRQVIGYYQRGLPAPERFVFATGQLYDLRKNHAELERKSEFKYGNGSFPDTSSSDSDFSGLGFDYGIYGGMGEGRGAWRGGGVVGCGGGRFINLYQAKTSDLQNLCSHIQDRKRPRV